MARMRPLLTEEQLNGLRSQAEARFYRACRDQLDPRVLVLHSVRFVNTSTHSTPRDGEADFVIADPEAGVAIVEVKGGGVSVEALSGQWSSVDRAGQRHAIKNPIEQAMVQKKVVLDLIKGHPDYKKRAAGLVLMAHAAFFPDVRDVSSLISPQCTKEMLGGHAELQQLHRWVAALFRLWVGSDSCISPLGEAGVAVVEEVFCKTVDVRPLVSVQLRDEEVRRIELTEQQSRILRALGARTRAKICGGAGTGKTLLALARARELAASGARTLLLCYNRPLADHLRFSAGSTELLRPMTFHQLCEWMSSEASASSGRDLLAEARRAYPAAGLFEGHLPYACALATEILPTRFDAIVVDEAQDFAPEYWLPLEMLLADAARSTLLVFYDQNQAVYHLPDGCPVDEAPLVLTVNCRNTRYIHETAYRYFRGDTTDPCDIDGTPITALAASEMPRQAELIRAKIAELIESERVEPEQIAVLTAGRPPEAFYALLRATTLPRSAKWSIEKHRAPNAVTLDTVKRFKGLEAAVAFLWGIAGLHPTNDRETIYVGLSRAKSRLVVVGTHEDCESLLTAPVTVPEP